MYFTIFTLILQVLLVGGVANWDKSPEVVLEVGEPLVLKCNVSNLTPVDVVRLVKKNGEDTYIISDNGDVKSEFEGSGRYTVTHKYDWGTGIGSVELEYSEVIGADSGSIGCQKLGDDDNRAYVDVKVKVPIKDFFIAVKQKDGTEVKVEDGDSVNLQEGLEGGVACKAITHGSPVPPTMSIKVGEEDVASVFKKDLSEEIGGSNDALKEYETTLSMSYYTATPSIEYNGKILTCKAEREGYEPVETSIKIHVEYAPIVTCPKYEQYGTKGEEVTLSCDVVANPQGQITWSWGLDKNPDNTIVSPGTNGNIHAIEEKVSEEETRATLLIKKLEDAYFANYILVVDNGISNKEVVIALNKRAEEANHVVTETTLPTTKKTEPVKKDTDPAKEPKPDAVKSTGDNNSSSRYLLNSLLLVLSIIISRVLKC